MQELDEQLAVEGKANSSPESDATILDVECCCVVEKLEYTLLAHPRKADVQMPRPCSLDTLPVHTSGPIWIIQQLQFGWFRIDFWMLIGLTPGNGR